MLQTPDTRTVTIPASAEHEGFHALTLTLPWVCLHCGGPRGEPFPTLSYDGSRCLNVTGWQNPCGHVEKYSDVRRSLDTDLFQWDLTPSGAELLAREEARR